MKAVVQRVRDASVSVDSKVVGAIDHGLLVYLGVQSGDTEKEVDYLVNKISKVRIFRDSNEKMNLNISDVNGQVLVISQFTLLADTKNGHRPSFDLAAKPDLAKEYYELFISKMEKEGLKVECGVFGAHMHVCYDNDGPVTILYDTNSRKN